MFWQKPKCFSQVVRRRLWGYDYIEALTQGSNVVMPNAGGGVEIAHELWVKGFLRIDLIWV